MQWLTDNMNQKTLVGAIIFVAVMAVLYFQERAAKNMVKAYLKKHRCQEIGIHRNLFVGRRGTFSFSVEYLDMSGVMQENTCNVHVDFIFSEENKIDWQQPFE